MRIRFWYTLAFTFLNLYFQSSHALRQLRLPASRRFLLLRTNMINQRACTCPTSFSCSCCETVTLSFSKLRKALCSNFMYQRNGMNVDVSLDTDTLRSLTVNNYRPFKVCTAIPGSLFSSICVNVLELNEFPRSITVCVRHEILSKFEEWQINYTCVIISTSLPTMTVNTSEASGIPPVSIAPMMATSASMTPMSSAVMMATSASMTPMSGAAMMATSASMTPMSGAAMMATSASMAPQESTMSQAMATTTVSMNTTPAGMMSTTTTTTTTTPSVMASSPEGRTRAMDEAGPLENGSGTGLPMMSTQRKRKKRYTRIERLLNYWSKIVNDKFHTQPLELKSPMRPTATVIRQSPTTIASSGHTVSDTEASILGDTKIDYNENPGTPEAVVLADSAAYFPSRIPPVVAMTLKQQNTSNPRKDDIFFGTDNDSQLDTSNTGDLIFPN